RAVLCWTSHDLVLLLVVVLVTRSTRGDRHRRGRLTLVQHYQIAEQLLVELQQTLVLGKLRRARLELRNHVVAGGLLADRIRELAATPVVHRGDLRTRL